MLITGEKSPKQLAALRQSGKILAELYRDLRQYVAPGMTELAIDAWVAERVAAAGAVATYKTAEVGFPATICISTNEQIVHSVPSDYTLEVGDVVSFDLVIAYEGMKTDAAFTMVVGQAPKGAVKHLLQTTERSLYAGIDAIHGATRVGDIAAAIEAVLAKGKLGIVRELVGHGVGHEMHMPPEVPNWGRKGTGQLLLPGETIAIEPMATLGGEAIVTDTAGDGWTISTRDGSLAAHFEHSVLVTDDGVEILTQL